MTYDLRRLRLKGIVQRVHKTHRYVLTPAGRRTALFMTETFSGGATPVLNRLDPSVPDDTSDRLRRAWSACEREIESALSDARIAA